MSTPAVERPQLPLVAGTGRAAAQWSLWTTTIRVVVDDETALLEGMRLLQRLLADVELAASRFRSDSEVSIIAASGKERHQVSALLADMVATALDAAEATVGRVDPTVGTVLTRLAAATPVGQLSLQRRATWHDVHLKGRELHLPAGTLLDLGATGKAFAADLAAESLARTLGCGVLVSLGGDLRTAGAAGRPWTVCVRDRADQPASLVDLAPSGALATSSSLHRSLGPSGAHHVIDPLSGRPVAPVWRTASVAADRCVVANTWSTAALVAGTEAPALLDATGLPARLVDAGGAVRLLGGWPR